MTSYRIHYRYINNNQSVIMNWYMNDDCVSTTEWSVQMFLDFKFWHDGQRQDHFEFIDLDLPYVK